jgi:HAD superfamily hydrolase (TIGR01459 family)
VKTYSLQFPIWLCDVWGVIHDGYAPFAAATEALVEHRKRGGTVVLLTNSPRSHIGVEHQLDEIGVTRDAWDVIVTSGDVTRTLMAQHRKLYHIGPSRDLSLFEGLGVQRVDLADAEAIICTGLVHEFDEKPDDYVWLAATAHDRALPFICANPDKVVRKGSRLIHCAGAIAEVYAKLGGQVLMAGKPYVPIYDLAMEKVAALRGGAISKEQVLAIGDGIETDIRGAADFGIASVLITGGINEAHGDPLAAVKVAMPGAQVVDAMAGLVWN